MSYASRWESSRASAGAAPEPLPTELVNLSERLQSMPPAVRAELQPLIADVLEHARFRGRIVAIVRESLERLRVELAMARFDLDVTRRECDQLRHRLKEAG
jgi:hypothetical protein